MGTLPLLLPGRLLHCWFNVVCRGVPLAAAALLCACAKPYVYSAPGTQAAPRLTQSYAVMEDGYRLPLSRWESVGNPRAVLLALHGLNDYRRAFANLGRYLADRDISVVAYDQRGFGATSGHGLWHGSQRLSADLVTMTALLRQEYPGIPLYLLGESMGGAVALASLGSTPLDVAGTILLAPAVWSRDTMPFYQRAALWIAAHTLPARRLTGEGLDIKPSDNIDMLRALGRDELVIKATRVDVLYGVSNLMDTALLAARGVDGNVLLLYGQHDEIIPPRPTCQLLEQLSNGATTQLTAIVYERGYHMLSRDLQAEVVLEDIAAWIGAYQAPQLTGGDLRLYCAQPGAGT